MAAVRVRINGATVEVPANTTALDALRRAGVHVPALCHDDRLVPTGSCRGCLVDVAGQSRPVTACTTHVADGTEITTNTPLLEQARSGIVGMLVQRYPAAAIQRFPDKPFHIEAGRAGVTGEASRAFAVGLQDRSHPYIAVDMSRCIDCYRCVRICAELQGQFVWHVAGRGDQTRIHPDGPNLLESSCVGCGACVDTCPTGALEDTGIEQGAPTMWTRTVCPYCGVGCEMNVGTRDDRIVTVRPALDAPVNKGHLCVKGRYAFGFVSAPDRVTSPMIREGDDWRRVSWNEARAFVATRLAALVDEHGADCIGILGSARATNEDNYVTQKFARVAIGTNNVDCCARVCHTPSATALKRALGSGLTTNSFDDIERAATILVCGANPTENHPVVGARIKQAALRGAHLIVIDPRRIELADCADVHLSPSPGTHVALLNAMAQTIVGEGLVDRRFIDGRVDGFSEFTAFIEPWTPERAAAICGVHPEDIRRAARLYATAGPAMSVHGLGVTEHVQGTDGVSALINLALLTGNLGRSGGGINPLRGQNNVQGAAHMGCDPGLLPGSTVLTEGRDACEALWQHALPATRGLHMLGMIDAAADRRLKALWVIGYDLLLTNPGTRSTRHALEALDLVIVQDMFMTETAREVGTVFLPACSTFEKDGTFMNAERRIQRVRPAVRAVGESKPDWRIICEVARAMGVEGFAFANTTEIWDEVRALCDGARGMTYRRLESAGLQWPCPAEDHPGTAILHQETFANASRARLQHIDFVPTAERVAPDYPFVLMTGRSLYQFNAGTMTSRSANSLLRPVDLLEISPADAERLALHDDDMVRVESRYGTVALRLRVTNAMRAGHLFATFQNPSTWVNALTSPQRDRHTATPEYKVTAVRLAPA